jgi:hypothetical protein
MRAMFSSWIGVFLADRRLNIARVNATKGIINAARPIGKGANVAARVACQSDPPAQAAAAQGPCDPRGALADSSGVRAFGLDGKNLIAPLLCP